MRYEEKEVHSLTASGWSSLIGNYVDSAGGCGFKCTRRENESSESGPVYSLLEAEAGDMAVAEYDRRLEEHRQKMAFGHELLAIVESGSTLQVFKTNSVTTQLFTLTLFVVTLFVFVEGQREIIREGNND